MQALSVTQMGAQLAWLLNMTERHIHAVVVRTYIMRTTYVVGAYVCTMVHMYDGCPLVHTRDTYIHTMVSPLDNVIRRPLYRLLQYARIIE